MVFPAWSVYTNSLIN